MDHESKQFARLEATIASLVEQLRLCEDIICLGKEVNKRAAEIGDKTESFFKLYRTECDKFLEMKGMLVTPTAELSVREIDESCDSFSESFKKTDGCIRDLKISYDSYHELASSRAQKLCDIVKERQKIIYQFNEGAKND